MSVSLCIHSMLRAVCFSCFATSSFVSASSVSNKSSKDSTFKFSDAFLFVSGTYGGPKLKGKCCHPQNKIFY